MAKMLSRSWVTTMIVVPKLTRIQRVSIIEQSCADRFSPADGSSKKRISGSMAMALARTALFSSLLISKG